MAKLLQPSPKFTHPEWVISNQIKYANAEGERAAAERLVDEANRVISETDKTTFKVQRDVNKKFDQRLDDERYWEKEVDDKLESLKVETDALDTYRNRILSAIEAYEEPLRIAQLCLSNRQRRIGIDLVHDDPEKELLKEVEVYQGVLALLHRTKAQMDEQMRLNRKSKYNLEKALADKFAAISIDEHNAELRNNSAGIHFAPGSAKISANSSTPDQWEDFANRSIEDTDRQCQSSAALRVIVDGVLQTTCNDMRRQKEETDVALARRIDETRDAKEKLEAHLAKVKRQTLEVEETIEKLERAMADKQNPMKLAQTRLEGRAARPNVELCRDAVQYRLVEEVTILGQSVDKLAASLAAAEETVKALRRQQLDIEADLAVKANTLYIDETECAGIRRSINIQYY